MRAVACRPAFAVRLGLPFPHFEGKAVDLRTSCKPLVGLPGNHAIVGAPPPPTPGAPFQRE